MTVKGQSGVTQLIRATAILQVHKREASPQGPVCGFCTRVGVGDNGGPVPWKCDAVQWAESIKLALRSGRTT
jgi:hypothetical protein